MRNRFYFIDFILREWLLLVAAAGLLLTSFYLHRMPLYSKDEIDVLFILWVLFIAVKGLERGGLLQRVSRWLEQGKGVHLKLVMATFLLSMVVTNDVSLVVVVPLTMLLEIPSKGTLVILEALAANAGSALTPFGNPQNLFIYWHYGLSPWQFVKAIAPLSLLFCGLLAGATFLLGRGVAPRVAGSQARDLSVKKGAWIYGALLVLMVLAVLRLLPLWVGVSVVLYAVLLDRDSMKVDYLLLLTFFCFFGLADNLQAMLGPRAGVSGNIFMLSALASQVISNVPAALLLANFTEKWRVLLWGTNVGGFGSLVASLANLIAYRLYITHSHDNDVVKFTWRFLALGYLSFFIGSALFFAL